MAALMTLEQIAAANPALITTKIRIDKETQQASVIDVVRLITGKSSTHASRALNTLEHVDQKMVQLRINGKGKKTPVCDATTMVEIIWELPGKAAKVFRRQCAHYIVRILGGDASLIEEMRDRAETSTSEQRDFLLGKRGTDMREQDEAAAKRLKLRQAEVDMDLYVKEKRAKCDLIDSEQKKVNLNLAAYERKINFDMSERERKINFDMTERERKMNESAVSFNKNLMEGIFSGDAHMQAAFKDYAMVALNLNVQESSNLDQFAPDISSIIASLGYRGQNNSILSKIGRAVSKAYKKENGSHPPDKTKKYVNGCIREVNAYRKSDLDMIQDVIRKILSPNEV